ncbi:uncharacterized protein I303_102355 [Kwoniella dejecticola CBS 10117]|uniref:Uncharacterized protein n=1 Tax=Kwoniella dejecticola CBS 10117 TaxID=1296121 RepID=A0A1A6AB77_9TREE|nr:uncharacterized protein I303_01505 [Kwoniella dejecticola CBS 10117]OBR87303.1 hypothetical protein I303_01505 [Kwoniella dejecticola CBS 10117]
MSSDPAHTHGPVRGRGRIGKAPSGRSNANVSPNRYATTSDNAYNTLFAGQNSPSTQYLTTGMEYSNHDANAPFEHADPQYFDADANANANHQYGFTINSSGTASWWQDYIEPSWTFADPNPGSGALPDQYWPQPNVYQSNKVDYADTRGDPAGQLSGTFAYGQDTLSAHTNWPSNSFAWEAYSSHGNPYGSTGQNDLPDPNENYDIPPTGHTEPVAGASIDDASHVLLAHDILPPTTNTPAQADDDGSNTEVDDRKKLSAAEKKCVNRLLDILDDDTVDTDYLYLRTPREDEDPDLDGSALHSHAKLVRKHRRAAFDRVISLLEEFSESDGLLSGVPKISLEDIETCEKTSIILSTEDKHRQNNHRAWSLLKGRLDMDVLRAIYPALDNSTFSVKKRCKSGTNRFTEEGSIHWMVSHDPKRFTARRLRIGTSGRRYGKEGCGLEIKRGTRNETERFQPKTDIG